MTDQRFTELLSKKLSDEILADEAQELMLMLAENEHYKVEYESLNEYFQQEEPASDDIEPSFQKIKARINIPETVPAAVTPIRPVKRSFAVWYRIAAVFILAVCALTTYRIFSVKRPADADQLSSITWKKLSTVSQQKSKVVLADGTTVTLNAETELKYPPAFKGGTREVYLSGEAFFDVARDHKHPFIVHTEKMSIKVLGTAFDVKSYKNEPLAEATLLRGSIQIILRNDPENHILLKPAEKFTLTASAAIQTTGLKSAAYHISPLVYYHTDDQNTIMETAWMDDKLVFKNENFALLSLRMARQYGVNFTFRSEELKNYKFTGEFEKESLSEALKALQFITPFQYKIQGKTIYLYPQN